MENFSLLSSDLTFLGTIWNVPWSCQNGPNVYIEGSQVIISKTNCISFFEDHF